jgi:hypothetical protein
MRFKMKSQKQSVLDGIVVVKGVLTKELSKSDIQKIEEIVLGEIEDGSCRFDSFDKYNTIELRFKYVKGMVNNWLRKSSELNDGVKYTPKFTKGPQKSETLKALEALSEKHPDNEEVQKALNNQRTKENEEKKKEVKINVDALPEHLRNLVG